MTGSGNFPPGRALRPEVRLNKEQEEALKPMSKVTRTHRLAVARAWFGADELTEFLQCYVDGDKGPYIGAPSVVAQLERLAKLVADASPSPEAVAHGRALLMEIGGDSEECWQQNDKTFENAALLADALARVVGYPQRDEDCNCFYPEQP